VASVPTDNANFPLGWTLRAVTATIQGRYTQLEKPSEIYEYDHTVIATLHCNAWHVSIII